MKTIENVTIYKCDFCDKKLYRKHAMVNHESKCYNNPENHRACLNGCKYLETRKIEYETGVMDMWGEPLTRVGNTFFCNKFSKYMLHPKVENEELLMYVYDDEEGVEQSSMLKECEEFDNGFVL